MTMFQKLFLKENSKSDYVGALDGLRGIAVLFILFSHSSKAGLYFSPYLDFTLSGKIGIYLFFVLSAYLLDRQICLALTSGQADSFFWKDYFQKRFFRIYPMYIFALILYFILDKIGFSTPIDELSDFPTHLLLIKGESIFWSIPVELKYYLISPIILLICHKFLKWNFGLVVACVSLVIIIPMICHYFYDMWAPSTFGYLPVFVTGTMVAIVEIFKIDLIKAKLKPALFDSAAFFFLAAIFLTIPFYFNAITGLEFNFLRPLLYVPYSALWGFILLSSKYGKGLMKRFLELSVFRFYGKISYSVYLLHLPVLIFCTKCEAFPEWSKIYLFFGLTTLAAIITYLGVERPGLKLKFFKKKI